MQYRTVVFITPACARNLNGASASEPSPAPQILKHSLIHPANILPQNQTKPSHIQIPNPLSTVRSTHPHLHQNLFLTSRAPRCIIMRPHLISSHIILTISKQNRQPTPLRFSRGFTASPYVPRSQAPHRDLMQCGSCGDIPAPGHLIFSC